MSPDEPTASRTTAAISVRMARQARHDTQIEIRLRSLLHSRGLRYRIHKRPLNGLRREADIVFTRAKVAVFVDGCFWHGCPDHGTWPKSNAVFWRSKIEGNAQRDKDTDLALVAAGWAVVRVWEHEDPASASGRVESVVRGRLSNT